MLALNFRSEDYAFVYFRGQAIGAIRVGAVGNNRVRSRVTLLFSGAEVDFQILRPSVVIGRYGEAELERLVDQFSLAPQRHRHDATAGRVPQDGGSDASGGP